MLPATKMSVAEGSGKKSVAMGLTEVGVANEKIPPPISNLQHSSAELSEKPRYNANAK